MAFLETMLGGANQGLIWALLAIGVFITYRILDFADLTIEGTFVLGGSVAAKMITAGAEPILSTMIAFLAGLIGGLATGLLHTKLKIPPILAGIITMTALYSINMLVMGKSSMLSLLGETTVITYLRFGGSLIKPFACLILGLFVVALTVACTYSFFGTRLGAAVRATGNNSKMAKAQGINTDNMKMLALMLSNGLVALSGALFTQYQGFSDVSMGIGTIVIGLASVIIGETIFSLKFPFWLRLVGIVIGSIIYRIIYTMVIYFGLDPLYIKLLTAAIVAVILALPTLKAHVLQLPYFKRRRAERERLKVVAAASGENTEADDAAN